MPFCMKCGSQLKPTDKFCGKCGYPVQLMPQNTTSEIEIQNITVSHLPSEIICLRCGTKHKLKDKLCWNCGCPNPPQTGQSRFNPAPQQLLSKHEYIAELDRMIEYFNKAQSWYDDYYTYLRDKEKAEADYRKTPEYKYLKHQNNLERALAYRRTRKTSALLMSFGIVMAIIALLATPFISKNSGWPLALLFVFGSLGLCAALIVVGFIILFKPTARKARVDSNQSYSQANTVYIKLRNYYKNYGYCILAADDTDPRKIRLIRDYIESGKATTVEEARKMANKRFHKAFRI